MVKQKIFELCNHLLKKLRKTHKTYLLRTFPKWQIRESKPYNVRVESIHATSRSGRRPKLVNNRTFNLRQFSPPLKWTGGLTRTQKTSLQAHNAMKGHRVNALTSLRGVFFVSHLLGLVRVHCFLRLSMSGLPYTYAARSIRHLAMPPNSYTRLTEAMAWTYFK